MRFSGYLLCSASGNVKYRKTPGGVGPREIPVTFSFELPDKLFQKPTIHLNIAVDPHGTVEVTPEMQERTRLNLEKDLGIKVELEYKDLDKCLRCNGTGNGGVDASGALTPCPACGGYGRVR
jgi:DnaJ-class molecular chaperone